MLISSDVFDQCECSYRCITIYCSLYLHHACQVITLALFISVISVLQLLSGDHLYRTTLLFPALQSSHFQMYKLTVTNSLGSRETTVKLIKGTSESFDISCDFQVTSWPKYHYFLFSPPPDPQDDTIRSSACTPTAAPIISLLSLIILILVHWDWNFIKMQFYNRCLPFMFCKSVVSSCFAWSSYSYFKLPGIILPLVVIIHSVLSVSFSYSCPLLMCMWYGNCPRSWVLEFAQSPFILLHPSLFFTLYSVHIYILQSVIYLFLCITVLCLSVTTSLLHLQISCKCPWI